MRLKDKISLITGASRGIGNAIALTFAREGSDVVVNYTKSRDKANETVNEIIKMGRRAIAVQADVANKDEALRMVDEAIKEFGRIDVLVNNAGIVYQDVKTASMLEASEDEWERVLGVNLIGTYHCIQAVAPHMIKQKYGKIINISSTASFGNVRTLSPVAQVAYAPSKAAVNVLTKKIAYELGEYNINVNVIAPGLIKTELWGSLVGSEDFRKRLQEQANITALRRVGEPQDIANAALFLASDESKFITGHILVVDGGRFDFLI